MHTRSLTWAGLVVLCLSLAAPAAAAIPRDMVSKVVRLDGQRARITLVARSDNPVISAVMDPENPENSGVVIVGGTVDLRVSLQMLDGQLPPEGIRLDRARLVRATPDASGRRTWNPVLSPDPLALLAEGSMSSIAPPGPAWETGARVDARVRITLPGETVIVELGPMRIGGDFTLAAE